MYPRISDAFRDLFGIELPFPIYSFGALLAIAILTAAWLAGRELDRMHANGRIGSVRIKPEDRKKRRKGRTREASPSVLVGTLTIMAAVGGIVGAKIFHILENLDQFFFDPTAMIFSTGGLTFYGGLIVAGGSIVWYLRKKDLSVPAFADAVAPGLMLAYGIGRIGCHLAGDGDWGIAANLALKPDWLPTWLWAETYPNAIIGPPEQPVYPTSIYEAVAAALLFGILWAVRKHPFKNGWLFSLYLVFNGIERFFIEQIRVNNVLDFVFFRATQAEVISVLTFLVGVIGLVLTTKRRTVPAEASAPSAEKATA